MERGASRDGTALQEEKGRSNATLCLTEGWMPRQGGCPSYSKNKIEKVREEIFEKGRRNEVNRGKVSIPNIIGSTKA